MVKPTNEQLKKIYPNIDTDYLSANIDRKMLLIELEDKVVKQIEDLISLFQEQIIGILHLPTNDKQKLIQSKISDMEFQISVIELDAIVHLYEMSGYSYKWIFDKYFVEVPTVEVGGEESAIMIKRKKLLKKDIQNMVEQTVSRNQTISTSTSGSLKTLQSDINRLSSNSVDVKAINNSFQKTKQRIRDSTRSILQQSVYDAEKNAQVYVSDDYEIVYYRVEVLDSSICMNCLQVDGSINEQPLGLLHKNCRGIDVVLLRDVETGKYYDTSHKGYGHKLKTKSFADKFESLSQKQKRAMLGKSNYDLYVNGKLKPDDFLSFGRQITNSEASIKSELNSLKRAINSPQKATNIAKYMDKMFKKPISGMSESELLAYEKCLGLQKQLYENVPKRAYTKNKPKQSYIDVIDAKYDELYKRRQKLNRKE